GKPGLANLTREVRNQVADIKVRITPAENRGAWGLPGSARSAGHFRHVHILRNSGSGLAGKLGSDLAGSRAVVWQGGGQWVEGKRAGAWQGGGEVAGGVGAVAWRGAEHPAIARTGRSRWLVRRRGSRSRMGSASWSGSTSSGTARTGTRRLPRPGSPR